MSMALDLFCRMEELRVPTALELSVFMGVHGYECPVSSRRVQIGSAICPLSKRAPSLALAAEDITLRSVLHSEQRTPLGVDLRRGRLGGPWSPRVKYPPAQLQTFLIER